MSSNLYDAANQYANRPADERFTDLPSLLAACQADDRQSVQAQTKAAVLHAKPVDREVILNGQTSAARLSHWSFGQLSAVAGEAYVSELASAQPWTDADAVRDALQDLGATEAQAKAAYTAAEQHEPDPRSVWGVMNGITRASQDTAFSSDRFTMDLLAAKVARRFARVAV